MKKHSYLLLVILVLNSASSALAQTKAGAESSPEIMFVGHADGDLDVYLSNPDSGETKKLTHNNRDDMHAVWSPDGNRIAYTSSETGNFEICVIDADGSNLQQLTENDTPDFGPAWSPDGSAIAYLADFQGRNWIRIHNLLSGEQYWLGESTHSANNLKYSPDGRMLAFLENEPGEKPWYVALFDLKDRLYRRVSEEHNVLDYDWSPDSTSLVVSARKDRMNNLHILNVAGEGGRQITEGRAPSVTPRWHPHRNEIYFMSSRDAGLAQLARYDVTSGIVERVSHSGAPESEPAFSKDGKYLVLSRFSNRFYRTILFDLADTAAERPISRELARAQLTPSVRPPS